MKSAIEENSLIIEEVGYDPATGEMDLEDLKAKLDDTVAGVLLENPNYLA